MAEFDDKRTDGAPPIEVHVEKKKTNWLAWLLLALGVLAALVALSRCHRSVETTTVVDNSSMAADPVGATSSAVANGTSGLAGYLAGTAPAPQTFTFEKVNFDTAKSAIRPADQSEIDSLAATLKQYGNAHVRIAGYADTRGPDAANAALGKARADSVKAALVAKGIDAARIETVSGGERDPVDTNATAGGRAENRRTELVVTQR